MSCLSIKFNVELWALIVHDIIRLNELDIFIILNVAMGGGFGGVVDPSFTNASMEVDYVRVYQ